MDVFPAPSPHAAVAPRRARSLWPREHGAYGQLGAPLLAALLAAPPTGPGLALAAAAVLAFLGNEPLLVVLGHRGARARGELGARAARRLIGLGLAAAALAGLAFAATTRDARLAVGLAALPAAGLVACGWRRWQHSLAGELLAALGFPAAAAPVLVAAHRPLALALAIWLAWSIGFAASIAAVHRVLARHRRPRAWPDHALAAGLVIALVAGGVLARTTPLAVIPLPLCAVSLALVVRPPSARRVRTVGVVLLAAALITAASTAAISAAILSAG